MNSGIRIENIEKSFGNTSVLKASTNKIEVLEETIKKLNIKLGAVVDRLNKM